MINYHLVWIPRYRQQIWTGDIEARLKQRLGEMAAQYGFAVLALEVMPDHGQLFVSAPPKVSPAEVVRLFKGITARRLQPEFLQIRRASGGTNATVWAAGYSVGTAGHLSPEITKRSIEECQKT